MSSQPQAIPNPFEAQDAQPQAITNPFEARPTQAAQQPALSSDEQAILSKAYTDRPWWKKMLGLGPSDPAAQQIEQKNLSAQKPGVESGLQDFYSHDPGGMYAMGTTSNLAQGVQDFSQGEIKKGIHHTVKGVSIGASPLLIPAAAAAPVATGLALAGSSIGSEVASKGAQAMGASQDTQDLAGDVGGVVGGIGGGAFGASKAPGQILNKITPDFLTDFLGRAKTALFTTPEERATAALPVRSAQDINSSALPELHQQVGGVLDEAANAKGVDTTSEPSLSAKAAKGGAAWKASGQAKYKMADEIAAEATGQDGAFQRLGQSVQDLKEQLADPGITPDEAGVLNTRLQNAQGQLDAYQKLAASKGVNVDALTRAADKEYSTGLSLEEFGRGVLQQETAAGGLKPSARPLDAPVRNLTAAASKRGHVLDNAVGASGSAKIQGAVDAAQKTIQAGKVQNSATKAAQVRVKQVGANRLAVAKIAGASGAAAAIGKALSGTK